MLADLGLPRGALGLALAGFNLGVETGQLTLVAVTFPLIYLLQSAPIYRRLILPAGSMVIALVARLWLIERSLDLDLKSLLPAA